MFSPLHHCFNLINNLGYVKYLNFQISKFNNKNMEGKTETWSPSNTIRQFFLPQLGFIFTKICFTKIGIVGHYRDLYIGHPRQPAQAAWFSSNRKQGIFYIVQFIHAYLTVCPRSLVQLCLSSSSLYKIDKTS